MCPYILLRFVPHLSPNLHFTVSVSASCQEAWCFSRGLVLMRNIKTCTDSANPRQNLLDVQTCSFNLVLQKLKIAAFLFCMFSDEICS